jgi:hypothetical protein
MLLQKEAQAIQADAQLALEGLKKDKEIQERYKFSASFYNYLMVLTYLIFMYMMIRNKQKTRLVPTLNQ